MEEHLEQFDEEYSATIICVLPPDARKLSDEDESDDDFASARRLTCYWFSWKLEVKMVGEDVEDDTLFEPLHDGRVKAKAKSTVKNPAWSLIPMSLWAVSTIRTGVFQSRLCTHCIQCFYSPKEIGLLSKSTRQYRIHGCMDSIQNYPRAKCNVTEEFQTSDFHILF